MLLSVDDDIDIIGINSRAVEEAFGSLRSEAARVGLIINSAKTKYMVAGAGAWADVGAEVIVKNKPEEYSISINLYFLTPTNLNCKHAHRLPTGPTFFLFPRFSLSQHSSMHANL